VTVSFPVPFPRRESRLPCSAFPSSVARISKDRKPFVGDPALPKGTGTPPPEPQAAGLGAGGIDADARLLLALDVLEHGEGMYVLDHEFRFVLVNEAQERISGKPRTETIGRVLWEVFPGAADPSRKFWGEYHRVMRERVPARFEEYYPPLDVWMSVSAFPTRDGGIAVFFRDVSDIKRTERALREADRRKDEFLGMLSHELRNPLAPIRNAIYILNHADAAGDQARRARAIIQRQTEHLTRLVDDLLDVTRIARGKIELRRERADLAALVRRTADDFRSVMDHRGVALTVNVPDRAVWAEADPTRVAQVFGNLLGNAAKFTGRGGRVVVTLATTGESAEVRVRDTGIGIEPALLPHVFEPFVQSDRSLARTQGGLGLGLALVKGIVELHGGSVDAESAGVGTGAELIVRLPIVSPAVPARGAATAAERHGRRVLVVDDDEDSAESLAQLIELFGHTPEVVYDGPTALERARDNPPDVVLCDIGLPGMSGYDVARALRAQSPPNLQLIALTAHAQPDDLRQALEAGFDTHVAKPADPETIQRLLA
jgi:PAS domain S-box-containing protein